MDYFPNWRARSPELWTKKVAQIRRYW